MYNLLKINILIGILYLFAGCGANGSLEVIKKGVFLDSAYVSGIRYKCDNISGITDKNGIFLFDSKVKQCEFYLGKNKFLVSPFMLQDRIITPFEITTSTTAALQLSRIIQSVGVKKNNVLIIDTLQVDKLGLVDLTNPVQVSANISAISPYIKTLADVKKDLSKHYDLKTGLILTPAQKEAQKAIIATPQPVNPINPTLTPPTCATGQCSTTTPPTTNCPVGAVCVVDKKTFEDNQICLPGASCPKPKDTLPCFPGSSCDDSKSTLSCLPGQSGVLCGSTNKSTISCLPGQACNNTQALSSCLPGTPCSSQSVHTGTSTPSLTPPSVNTTPSDNAVCLPGASCAPQIQNSTTPTFIQGSSSATGTQPTTTQCTPLPGKIC